MKKQKVLFLFLALGLPICIFLFLKFFGKNEFAVKPLFVDTYPDNPGNCPQVRTLPYYVPDSVLVQLAMGSDSLLVVYAGPTTSASDNQLSRVEDDFGRFPVGVVVLEMNNRTHSWKTCIFYLSDPLDVVLLDRRGTIRGQYEGGNREDMDRLLTELSIILKQY